MIFTIIRHRRDRSIACLRAIKHKIQKRMIVYLTTRRKVSEVVAMIIESTHQYKELHLV
jgi:hypothetical protein